MPKDKVITITMDEAQHIAFFTWHMQKNTMPDEVVHVLEKIKNEYENYMKEARMLMESAKQRTDE